MEKIVSFLKNLLSKKTGVGRTIRTLLQTAIGLGAFIISVWSMPGVQDFVSQGSPELLASATACVTITTAIWNFLEYLYANLKSFAGE